MQRRRCCPERALNSRAELTRCCRPRLNLTGRLTPGTPTAPRRSRARPCCPAEREADRACAPARFQCATGCLGRHDRRQERDRGPVRGELERGDPHVPRGIRAAPRDHHASRPVRGRRGIRIAAAVGASFDEVTGRAPARRGERCWTACALLAAAGIHGHVRLEAAARTRPTNGSISSRSQSSPRRSRGRSRGMWGERRNASEATPRFIRYFVRFAFPIYAPELECICYAESTRAGVNELETVMHPLLHENARPC